MSTRKRLEALEKAREGSDLRPIELWTQDQAEPGVFTLRLTGERLSRAELEARKGAQIILVMYGERP